MRKIVPYSDLWPKQIFKDISKEDYQERITSLEEKASLDAYINPPFPTSHPLETTIRHWIDTLPDQHQELIYLYFGQGISIVKIGEQRGVTKQAVWQQIKRLLKKLKQYLEVQGITEETITDHNPNQKVESKTCSPEASSEDCRDETSSREISQCREG